ncbi:MAG: DNA repair protein RadC [Puniceicoccales bacterium]|nr:DNA repair protein RadC [Puniceicoccales bacterium]
MDLENVKPLSSSSRLDALPAHDWPRERLEKLGARSLQDAELIALLLRTGAPGEDVLSLSSRLMHDAGSLYNLVSWTIEDFRTKRGIGRVKAQQLITVMEVARRVVEQGKDASLLLDNPASVYAFFEDIARGLEVEKCWALCLNKKYRLIRCVEVTSGTASSTLVHPREVFRPALRLGSAAVVVVHNHPSGDPAPSRPDIAITRQLSESGRVLGIDLLDHVILGSEKNDPLRQGWFSFKNAGLLG